MDHYLQIIILGIVEGVTEFLPISSTGHLLIAENLLGTHMPDIFNVVIQAGAIMAVVFIYWHKITDLFGNLDRPEARSYLFKLAAAFIVTCGIGYIAMEKYHLKLPETLAPVAWATLIGGLVIFAVEAFAKHLYPHEDVSWPEAIIIGVAQIVAGIFPGTSRSGATIMAGMTVGMKRTSATEFSFLVGIPTMFAASAHELVKYRKDLMGGGHQLLLDIVLGFFVSMVVAFFVVKWLLRFIQTHTFNGFGIYRVLLGGGLLIALYCYPSLAEIGKEKPKLIPVEPVEMVPPPKPPAILAPTPPTETAFDSLKTNTVPIESLTTSNSAATNAPAASTNEVVAPRALPVTPSEMTNAAPVPTATGTTTSDGTYVISRPVNQADKSLSPAPINQPIFNVHQVQNPTITESGTTIQAGPIVEDAPAPVKKSPPAPYNPKLGHQNRTTTVTAPTTTPPVALTGATNTLIAPAVPATAASTNSAPANVPTH